MINNNRLLSKALVADILVRFLLYIIILDFEKMTLRSYGVNLIYVIPLYRYPDLEAESQCLIPGTTSLLVQLSNIVWRFGGGQSSVSFLETC